MATVQLCSNYKIWQALLLSLPRPIQIGTEATVQIESMHLNSDVK